LAQFVQFRLHWLVTGISFLVILVLGVSVLARKMASEAASAFTWVTHTHLVLAAIDAEVRTLVDAEAAARGYLLTADEDFLRSFNQATNQLPERLNAIKNLTLDNSAHQARLIRLLALSTRRLAILEERIRSQRTATKAHVVAREGKRTMDEVLQVAAEMKSEETSLLNIRREKSERYIAFAKHSATLFLPVGLGILALIIALAIHVHRLQKLVTVCARTKTVKDDGCWISFEDYLQKRFNIHASHGISDKAAEIVNAELAALASQQGT
jgi:CHASE3 domain sensor protein